MGVPADYASRPAQVNVTHGTFSRIVKESRVMGRILENIGVFPYFCEMSFITE